MALIDGGLAPAPVLNVSGKAIGAPSNGVMPVADMNPLTVAYSQDFTGSGSGVDQYGHGTFVAGLIAGDGAASTGLQYSYTMRGIAPQVSLVYLRVLDQNGAGRDSEVIAAINQAIALKTKFNIRVMNLSLGRPIFESYHLDPLCEAVEKAWKAGIVVVNAAGNYGRDTALGTNGYFTTASPANDPYVITVGAMNTEGSPALGSVIPTSYTSKGPSWGDWVVKPDLTAPGNLVLSLYAQGQTLANEDSAQIVPSRMYEPTGRFRRFAGVYRLEWNERGGADGHGDGGLDAAAAAGTDAGSGEVAPDEYGQQESRSEYCGDGQDHGQVFGLPRGGGPVHGWCEVPECRGSPGEHGAALCGSRQRTIAQRRREWGGPGAFGGRHALVVRRARILRYR